MFPEGHIESDDNIDNFKSGAVMFAVLCNVPIVQIYIEKREHWYNRQRIYVGERFDILSYSDGKKPSGEKMVEIAEILRQKVIELSNMHKETYGKRLHKKD